MCLAANRPGNRRGETGQGNCLSRPWGRPKGFSGPDACPLNHLTGWRPGGSFRGLRRLAGAPQFIWITKTMFAVIKTGGKQYRVTPGDIIVVEKLTADEGSAVTFDSVLMLGEDGKTPTVGTPMIADATVTGEVVEQGRGEKITVFKKKRRQGYRRTKGHRQLRTVLKITGINGQGSKAGGQAAKKPAAQTGRQEDREARRRRKRRRPRRPKPRPRRSRRPRRPKPNRRRRNRQRRSRRRNPRRPRSPPPSRARPRSRRPRRQPQNRPRRRSPRPGNRPRRRRLRRKTTRTPRSIRDGT